MLLRLLVLLAVTVGSIAWAHDANADCGRPWVTGPIVDARAGITLESIDVRMECSRPRGRTPCRLRETYVVRGGPSEGTPAAIWFGGTRPEVHIDGLRPVTVDPPQLEGDDAQRLEVMKYEDGEVMGFLIPTSPGMVRRIVIESRVRADRKCHTAPPIERRHPLVSRNVGIEIGISAQGSLGFTTSPNATETNRVRLPPHWEIDRREGWRRDRDGQRGEWIAEPWKRYDIELRPPVTLGGPFAAIGVAHRMGTAEMKVRAGWEAGILRRLLVNVAIESDARRHLEVVPAFELTLARGFSRGGWWIPLPSIGMGAPVQVVPDTRGGVRGLVGLHWPYVAIVGFLDGYPPIGSRRRIVTGGAMLQIGI